MPDSTESGKREKTCRGAFMAPWKWQKGSKSKNKVLLKPWSPQPLQTQKWAAVGIKLNESMMKEEVARTVDMCSSVLPQESTSCTLQDISATVQPAREIHIIWEMPWKEVWTWTKSTAVERETVNANKKANFCWMIQWGITLKLLWGLQEQILLLVLGWKSSVLLTSPAQFYPLTLSCTLAWRKIQLKSCTWEGGSRDGV